MVNQADTDLYLMLAGLDVGNRQTGQIQLNVLPFTHDLMQKMFPNNDLCIVTSKKILLKQKQSVSVSHVISYHSSGRQFLKLPAVFSSLQLYCPSRANTKQHGSVQLNQT